MKDLYVSWLTASLLGCCSAFAVACGAADHGARAQPSGAAGAAGSGSLAQGGQGTSGTPALPGASGSAGSTAVMANAGASGAASKPRLEQQAPEDQGNGLVLECWTLSPGIATGRDETDGALCFGLTYGAVFECQTSADDIATCSDGERRYVVVWAKDSVAAEVPSGTLGRIYDELGGNYLALVFRNEEGAYVIDWGNGELDRCHGPVDDFCRLHRK